MRARGASGLSRISRPPGRAAMQVIAVEDAAPIATGVPGLDEILAGGYASNRVHLVEGRPGSGKTTLGLQFLLDGLRHGDGVCTSPSPRASASSCRWRADTAGPWT